ncbi:U3 small nucleolar ribonucleoprotein protein IMP4 isoform X6 [Brassica rapa]|uniref:U3 small nucleolar ribonucleoprotein protein IMP4 isoform X6 n=1 Tax=Brassica campestris TaxID=3711 RepID=UPI00142DF454|nr:U3 small nucleolar ribonucleoprotein protein IMP4 isoform X6 [Brassica rapa]
MEEMMKTTKAGEELVQAKMRREITKLDDEELWAEFEPLEIDRIESGEIKPKTLITNCGWFHSPQFRERGPLIVKEMLSVFPNSTYIKWKRRWIPNSLKDLIRIAKERECTSLVLVDTNHLGHDEICIVSLLNGAAAYFRIFNLIPREDIPDQATPPTRLDPYVRMARFASQAGLGLSRLIQSLFPKATHSRTNKPCQKNRAFFQYQDGFVFYRHHWLPTLFFFFKIIFLIFFFNHLYSSCSSGSTLRKQPFQKKGQSTPGRFATLLSLFLFVLDEEMYLSFFLFLFYFIL